MEEFISKNDQHIKCIEIFGKQFDIKKDSELDIIQLLNEKGIKFDITNGDKPVRFNLGLIFTRNTRNARFLEINTDNFSFGFCCGKLRYIIINCELDLGVKIIGTDNIESNIYDVFSVYRMVEDLSKIDFEEFFIEHYFKYRNTIAHAGKDSGNWYVAFEFEG